MILFVGEVGDLYCGAGGALGDGKTGAIRRVGKDGRPSLGEEDRTIHGGRG